MRAHTIAVAVLIQPSPVVESPIVAPTAIPTATPLPPGTVVNINGVIEQVNVTNNVTTIVVSAITYILPHNVVAIVGNQLRIGAPIIFVGQVDVGGQIIVINVTHINNRVIVIKAPRMRTTRMNKAMINALSALRRLVHRFYHAIGVPAGLQTSMTQSRQ